VKIKTRKILANIKTRRMSKKISLISISLLAMLLSCNHIQNENEPRSKNIQQDSILLRKYSVDRKEQKNKLSKTNESYTLGIRVVEGNSDYFCFIFPDTQQTRGYQIAYHICPEDKSMSAFWDREEKFDLFFKSSYRFIVNGKYYTIEKYYQPHMSKTRTDSNFPSYEYMNPELGILAIELRSTIFISERNSLAKDSVLYNTIINLLIKKIANSNSFDK
jgi:hypothetical protein